MTVKQYIVRMPDQYNVPRLNGANSVLVTAEGETDAREFGALALNMTGENQKADLEVTEALFSLSTVEGVEVSYEVGAAKGSIVAGPGDTMDDLLTTVAADMDSQLSSTTADPDTNTITVTALATVGLETPWTVTVKVPLGDSTYTLVDGAPSITGTGVKADQDVVVTFPPDLGLPRASATTIIT